MKRSTTSIRYDTQKLCVLRQYMKDDAELQAGLEASLQALYEKHVPAAVRKDIESRKQEEE